MIKSSRIKSSRFSFSLVSAIFIFMLGFALVSGFAPAALGQSSVNGRAGSDSIVLSQTLPGLLVLGPHADLRDSKRRDRDACVASSRGQATSSNCAAVPEGGTALAYLSLVALGCLAAGIFTMRRQARLRETK